MKLLRTLPDPIPSEMRMDDDRERTLRAVEIECRDIRAAFSSLQALGFDRREFHLLRVIRSHVVVRT